MDGLQVFNNSEFGQLEVLIINGKEYFPATACAKMLGYTEPQKAIGMHCKGVSEMDVPTAGGKQAVNYIPEGDLYRLIIRSKLPTAEKFERWISDKIVPSIRRQGTYMPDMSSIVGIISTSVCEAVKQMIPSLRDTFQVADEVPCEPIDTIRHHKKKKKLCAIEKLEPDLRHEVDEMLLSDRYGYSDVAKWLESHNIKLSLMAVRTYYNKMRFWEW